MMRKAAKNNVYIILTALLSLSGCATYKTAEIDPKSGQFASIAPISESEVKINRPMAGIKDIPFVYVRTISTFRSTELDAFVRDSLTKIGFPKQVSEDDLTKLVIRSGLSGEIQNLTNVIALHRLSEAIGPFLVVEVRVFRIATTAFRVETVIVDPVLGETVFLASRSKINWIDFDHEFSYPMMNAVKSWFDASAKLPLLRDKAAAPGGT
jgi:uncharacterized protein YceK